MHVAILVSDFHAFVTAGLERGARAALGEAGVADADVEVFRVPGSYELAQAAQRIAESRVFAAVVCLGCVIRGETPHFEYIARAVADGITRAAQATGVPITFGVLTTNTADEALARAGDGPANKGREAAAAAIALARLYENAARRSDKRRAGRGARVRAAGVGRSRKPASGRG
jgi:6,7-dimethyl-8-ribityllumazine synthase